jgi:hypothetical protein
VAVRGYKTVPVPRELNLKKPMFLTAISEYSYAANEVEAVYESEDNPRLN